MDVTYDVTAALRAQMGGHPPLVFDARGNGGGTICPTITGDHENRITDYTAVVVTHDIYGKPLRRLPQNGTGEQPESKRRNMWGGSEVLLVYERTDSDNQGERDMSYQSVTGTLSQGAHPGSYNGQDAYNDMLVVDNGNRNGIGTSKCRDNEGGCPCLNASHEQPIMMSDRKGHNGITQDGTATTLTAQEKERPIVAIGGMIEDAAARNQILRVLQETYGTQAVVEWGIAILDALQQAEILRNGVYESGVSGEAETRNELDDNTLPRPEFAARWIMRSVREQQECGCTPQGREPAEQRTVEPATAMPELSLESAQTAREMFNMWQSGQGLGLLQQALSQIQEIWKSAMEKRTGGDAMTSVVRRLTPLE